MAEDLEFQHSISQFILKRFRDISKRTMIHNGETYPDKQSKIWVLDKQTGQCDLRPIDEVAGEGGLYDIVGDRDKERDSNLERAFSKWESRISVIYREILRTKKWPVKEGDAELFIKFLWSLSMRAPDVVNRMSDINQFYSIIEENKANIPSHMIPGVNAYLERRNRDKGRIFSEEFDPQLNKAFKIIYDKFNSMLLFPKYGEFILGDRYKVILGQNKDKISAYKTALENADYVVFPISGKAAVLLTCNEGSDIDGQKFIRGMSIDMLNAHSAAIAVRYVFGANKDTLTKAVKESENISWFNHRPKLPFAKI